MKFMPKLAIVRIRGDLNLDRRMRMTFQMMNLLKKQACVVLEDSPSVRGMIHVLSPFVTWGEIDEASATVLAKKGEQPYRLHPPKGGFERKGIKMPFSKGGVTGYRGSEIVDLVRRMSA